MHRALELPHARSGRRASLDGAEMGRVGSVGQNKLSGKGKQVPAASTHSTVQGQGSLGIC